MTLDTLNFEWANFLRSGRCPPILGLVPLSESEYTQTGALIAAKLRDWNLPAYQALIELLSRYPAIVGIWIARKAGEAYDAGGFGEKFEKKTSISVPANGREDLASRFRQGCRQCMANYTQPTDLGTRKYVLHC